MDIHTAPVSLKCIHANHELANEQSVHIWDREEDCSELNTYPH